MKKIFTLLLFVAAMALTANADNAKVQNCIDVALGKEAPAKFMGTNMDVNNDGVVDVADVALLIKMDLNEKKDAMFKAPAQRIDVDKLIRESLETRTGEPNISDVNKAIDHNLRIE